MYLCILSMMVSLFVTQATVFLKWAVLVTKKGSYKENISTGHWNTEIMVMFLLISLE